MTEPIWELQTFTRGRSASRISNAAHKVYCHLSDGQPLLLLREPANPADPAAVRLSDLLGASCGYIAREHAPVVAGRLDSGQVLLAKAVGPCRCIYRRILVWSEGEETVEVEASFRVIRKVKEPERLEGSNKTFAF